MALGTYYGTPPSVYTDLREVLEDKYSYMLLYKTRLSGVNLRALGMNETITGYRQYITIVDDLPEITGKKAADLGATKKVERRKTAFEPTGWTKGVGYERRVLRTSTIKRAITIPDLAYKEVLASLNINMECLSALSNILALEADYTVISALLGKAEVLPDDSYAGEGSDSSNKDLDPNETIKKEGGMIDIKMLLDIKVKFQTRYLTNAPVYILCNEHFIAQLLQIKEVTSSDFNVVKPLVNGMVYGWLGMQFIMTPSTILGGAGTKANPWVAIAIVPNAFKFGDKMRKMSVVEIQERSMEAGIYVEETFGAVRTDEKRVIKITHTEES